ncbi:MAG TPA: helix-turn-helix transcriptional regulator [Candidatus Dormibacteraeota bacterium]|nr:helix-turn-helix transcriptional regulator [Candidatus Dormibacteraeota bacterium]
MHGELRVTTAVARVLRAFLDDPGVPRYGFDLMRVTRLPSGTLYPILARLERLGWVAGRSEEIDPAVEGRPARRFYRLTDHGLRQAASELTALSDALRVPARLSPEVGPA